MKFRPSYETWLNYYLTKYPVIAQYITEQHLKQIYKNIPLVTFK